MAILYALDNPTLQSASVFEVIKLWFLTVHNHITPLQGREIQIQSHIDIHAYQSLEHWAKRQIWECSDTSVRYSKNKMESLNPYHIALSKFQERYKIPLYGTRLEEVKNYNFRVASLRNQEEIGNRNT